MHVHEVCIWCGKIITEMHDEYDPRIHFPVCMNPACYLMEIGFQTWATAKRMNIMVKQQYGRSQADVPAYKGHS